MLVHDCNPCGVHWRISSTDDWLSSEAAEIADLLQRLVRSLDDLAVELKRTLGLNQINQFGHWIDIGTLEKSLADDAEVGFTGDSRNGFARCGGRNIEVFTDLSQPALVDKLGKLDLPDNGQLGLTGKEH